MDADAGASVLTGDWVPVTLLDSAPEAISGRSAFGLRELLEYGPYIASLAVTSPPALSALYRVLYALAARVTRLDREPEDGEDWEQARLDILVAGHFDPSALDEYFNRYAARFGLFDPARPFLQDPRLAEQCQKRAGVNKLAVGRPAGNNHSWFGHHRDEAALPVPRRQALLDLLVWLYYGASGKCSARTVQGRADSNTKAGPLRSALSYHPVGESLFETLIAGIPNPDVRYEDPDDPCPWEREDLPDPRGLTQVRGVCSSLTGRAQHAVLLVPDASGHDVADAYITWAYRDDVAGDVHDPYLIWQLSKAGNLYARRADAGRALWRDLDALAFQETADSSQIRQPPVFAHLPRSGFRVQALGFDQDGQAKDTQFVAGLTPPQFDAARLREQGQNRLRIASLREAGETMGFRLERSAKKAWAEYAGEKIADCAWSQQAAARYWPAAEELFWRRMAAGAFDGARQAFRLIAEPIYDEVTRAAAASLRGARAVEMARFELYGGLPKQSAPPRRREPTVTRPAVPVSASQQRRRDFIETVIRRCTDPRHPEARAALRGALGKRWDAIPHGAYKFLEDAGLPEFGNVCELHAHYAVAAMIAAVPRKVDLRSAPDASWRYGSDMGVCLASAVARQDLTLEAAEGKLDLLVKQSTAGLHRHLPPVALRLAARPGAVDWAALLADLAAWERERNTISRRWLRSFYRTRLYAQREAARAADGDPAA
ncbi:type I-E CRISPR-associated protein Cse1/CasA [Actinocrinis puniceicyclus]|uniref:Type I-E CRISPR-associated protein Cse1/CasA n=1 Tax=Actinocrinis puniceicyclus TaxID=977794 RepID=A0A8J7WKG1_9ACTN|nr:type I-E CRISPR-associated protein Cse1/CasA [Actinocrinis puniceicyclus]MBS2963946.1 type I-E CRISPR-associated protein Cse1/CasA [Actinocrinis puniceicyclus]